jgi:hypothetical protein
VTAKQVDALATSISNLSGLDDETVKSGESILLTFTRIRDSVGKGNDIFTQATKVATGIRHGVPLPGHVARRVCVRESAGGEGRSRRPDDRTTGRAARHCHPAEEPQQTRPFAYRRHPGALDVLALRSPDAFADAYGLVASPPDDGISLAGHLKGGWYSGPHPSGATWSVVEVTFDEADIFGTFSAPGAPGVIGLCLDDYTEGSTVADNATADGLLSLDLTDYTVPDLRPDPAGYMAVRGFVWTPDQGKRAYP